MRLKRDLIKLPFYRLLCRPAVMFNFWFQWILNFMIWHRQSNGWKVQWPLPCLSLPRRIRRTWWQLKRRPRWQRWWEQLYEQRKFWQKMLVKDKLMCQYWDFHFFASSWKMGINTVPIAPPPPPPKKKNTIRLSVSIAFKIVKLSEYALGL